MRDKRFVAAHRGGPLTLPEHRLLAAWAADCAEHLLPLFELHSLDSRPRLAIEVGRAWVRGELKTGVAQRAAVAAHAAAREATDTAAGGLTSEPNQPRHPHGIRGDRNYPALSFSTAPRCRFQPPSTLPSPSWPATPVSLFSGRPPRATACAETGSDLGK